jgi:hypothetical protein
VGEAKDWAPGDLNELAGEIARVVDEDLEGSEADGGADQPDDARTGPAAVLRLAHAAARSRPFHRDRAFRRSPRAREGQDASVQEAESHAPCEAWLYADSLAAGRGRGLAPLDAHPVQDEADTKE